MTEQQVRDLRRLVQEYASVTAEIERQEQALQGVARVMNNIVREQEQKGGIKWLKGMFRWPDWYKEKHTGQGVSISGMTLEQASELYRVLTSAAIMWTSCLLRASSIWQTALRLFRCKGGR